MLRNLLRLRPLAALGFMSLSLAGCASPPEASAGLDPPLVLERFFAGRTQGEGVFTNSWSGSERRFHVDIASRWDGRVLTLVEDFVYADGEKDRKTWRFEQRAPGVYDGTREDVLGRARVWTEGNVVRLEYAVTLGGWTVDFADVLALRADGSVLNRAIVGKWGLRIGRVELVMRPAS